MEVWILKVCNREGKWRTLMQSAFYEGMPEIPLKFGSRDEALEFGERYKAKYPGIDKLLAEPEPDG